jgi:hypothetical protein
VSGAEVINFFKYFLAIVVLFITRTLLSWQKVL